MQLPGAFSVTSRKSGYLGRDGDRSRYGLGTSASVPPASGGRLLEQLQQADAWGRFAGTGAENPRMRGNCASAYRPDGPVEVWVTGGDTNPTLS